jgi:HSP90 family molecular chaperone
LFYFIYSENISESENLKKFRLVVKRRLLSENKTVKDQPKRDKTELQKFLESLYEEELLRYKNIWSNFDKILSF